MVSPVDELGGSGPPARGDATARFRRELPTPPILPVATQERDNATGPAPLPKPGAARGLVAATWVVSSLTFLSRIAGLVRDAANSRTFGSGPDFGAFTFAFLLPNLFRRLFGEGALTASFLPRYTRLLDADPARARAYARLVIGSTALVLVAITLLVETALAALWLRWRGEADLSMRVFAIELTMLLFPYMPMVCATAVLGAVLQVHGRFGPTAAAPILLNVGIIIPTIGAALYAAARPEFDRGNGLYFVGIGVLVSGAAQIAWSLAALGGIRAATPRPTREQVAAMRPDLHETWRFALPMILGLGVLQLNTFLDGLIASYPFLVGPRLLGLDYPLDGHSAAVVGYAQRLYQFPLGVFGIAVATAIYPALARASRDNADFADVMRHGLRLTFFIGLPATIGLLFVATPLTAVIYSGGQFPAEDVARVARVLAAYSPSVCAYSIIHVLTRAYFARGDSTTPVRISLAMVGGNLVLNLTLIWWLGEAGLAASTSICSLAQVVLLLRGTRRLGVAPIDAPTARALARIAGITLAMTLMLGAAQWLLPEPKPGWSGSVPALLILTLAGLAAYLGAARWWNLEEWRWLRRRGEGI